MADFRLAMLRQHRREVDERNVDSDCGLDGLARLAIAHRERGPQDFVAADQIAKARRRSSMPIAPQQLVMATRLSDGVAGLL